jgi:hypothetical protein
MPCDDLDYRRYVARCATWTASWRRASGSVGARRSWSGTRARPSPHPPAPTVASPSLCSWQAAGQDRVVMTDVFEPTDHGLHYYVLPKDDPVEALNSSLRIERGLTQ